MMIKRRECSLGLQVYILYMRLGLFCWGSLTANLIKFRLMLILPISSNSLSSNVSQLQMDSNPDMEGGGPPSFIYPALIRAGLDQAHHQEGAVQPLFLRGSAIILKIPSLLSGVAGVNLLDITG